MWDNGDPPTDVAAILENRRGDCALRAVTIATGLNYSLVREDIVDIMRSEGMGNPVRQGVPMCVLRPYLADLGWTWVPTMGIGTGAMGG